RQIVDDVTRQMPGAHIDGVVVQEQVSGLPVIVGTKRDSAFGPVVLVGMGGVEAELIGDRALALAPLDAEAADALLDRTKLASLLDGWRGAPPLARAALRDLIVAVSELAHDDAGMVSVELNPVLVGERDVIAVDALIERAGIERGEP